MCEFKLFKKMDILNDTSYEITYRLRTTVMDHPFIEWSIDPPLYVCMYVWIADTYTQDTEF